MNFPRRVLLSLDTKLIWSFQKMFTRLSTTIKYVLTSNNPNASKNLQHNKIEWRWMDGMKLNSKFERPNRIISKCLILAMQMSRVRRPQIYQHVTFSRYGYTQTCTDYVDSRLWQIEMSDAAIKVWNRILNSELYTNLKFWITWSMSDDCWMSEWLINFDSDVCLVSCQWKAVVFWMLSVKGWMDGWFNDVLIWKNTFDFVFQFGMDHLNSEAHNCHKGWKLVAIRLETCVSLRKPNNYENGWNQMQIQKDPSILE